MTRIAQLFENLNAPSAAVKYGSAKILRQISEERPAELYPRFDDFVHLFEGNNTILRWGATRILGNLAAVDSDERLGRMLDRFCAPVSGHELIGAANVIVAAGQIAQAKPQLADRVAAQIIKVERATYATPECRNVAIGHAIKSLDGFFPHVRNRKRVLDFVARQLENPRQATRRKAERFMKRWAAA